MIIIYHLKLLTVIFVLGSADHTPCSCIGVIPIEITFSWAKYDAYLFVLHIPGERINENKWIVNKNWMDTDVWMFVCKQQHL